MKNILKVISFFLLVFIGTPFSSAYKAEDYKSFYLDAQNNNWETLLVIPDGKDFIMNYIYADTVGSNYLNFRDDTTEKGLGDIKDHKNEIFLAFQDTVEVRNNGNQNKYTITGFFVSEDEDIQGYIEGNNTAWNKHIFDKADIDFIYFREFIIMFFLVMFKFFSIIIGRNVSIF